MSPSASSRAIRDELFFRADVAEVAPGTLPRFELKAKRVIHHEAHEDTEKGKSHEKEQP